MLKMATLRQFIVRSDNVTFNFQQFGIKVIEASNGPELLEKICRAYELPWPMIPNHDIQIWSGQLGVSTRIRVDKLDEIPHNIQDVWIWASGSVGRGF